MVILLDEATIEAIREAIPVCPIHEIKMTPVSWYLSKGETTETDYACRKCIEERKPDEPVCLSSGPIIPYDWYWRE